MTCLDVEKKMTKFVNQELELAELQEFTRHIKNCDACKEYLEVYYILFMGMKLLDSDKENYSDFHIDFEKMLKTAEETIRTKKIRKIQKKAAILLFVLFVCFFL